MPLHHMAVNARLRVTTHITGTLAVPEREDTNTGKHADRYGECHIQNTAPLQSANNVPPGRPGENRAHGPEVSPSSTTWIKHSFNTAERAICLTLSVEKTAQTEQALLRSSTAPNAIDEHKILRTS
jgi:hypothetical protein